MDTLPTSQSLNQEAMGVLEKYFHENDFVLTRHHIDSYEQAVFDEIPSIIHSANPIVFLKEPLDKDAGVFAYRVEIFIGGDVPSSESLAMTISPPVVTLDGGRTVRRMFPNEARLRNLTYSAQINADILIRVTFTKPKEGRPGQYDTDIKEMNVIKNFPLFRLPILLRSRLCPTSVMDPIRLEEMGECRNDYGGYFVIGGAEKVLITREEQAFNALFVEKKREINNPQKLQGYSSVVSLHPETKQTRRVALYMGQDGEIRVAVPMIRGVFPVFILFRALGVESDEDIVRMIFPDVNAEETRALQNMLIPSIYDAYPILNKYLAIKYIMTLTKGFTEAHVLDILQNLMLAHVPDEPFTRAQYLAEMIRETLRCVDERKPNTSRDDMRNKRFLTTGTLVRELFNACYKDWRKEVSLTIDRTYRRNEQLYQGDDVFKLFEDGNLMTMFQPATLNKAIMRGFRGKWGTDEFNTKTGVLQPLARISYLDATSHTRRVVSDFDAKSKTPGPRKLHTSQVGYFCTSETPTGAHIGITKNMSIMTQFSLFAKTKPLYDWLRLKGGVIPVAETTAELRGAAATVQMNGGTVGFTMEPRELVRILRLLKWNACIPPTASISFNTTERVVRIFLDEGRCIRPLWHVNGESMDFLKRIPDIQKMSWRDLVCGRLPATATATMRTTRFLDPLADSPSASFADYEQLLGPTAGFIEYCDPTEMNEAFVTWWGGAELTPEHTHVEIHPSTMQGLLASMIPYANHNQAPRNQLSCSQSKQGIGYMVTNPQSRFDSSAHQLCYGEAPLCRTFYYENIGNGEMPYGFNCIIAAASLSGYNQDDGLIINSDSVARGMFQSLNFRTYDCAEEIDPLTKVHSHIASPVNVPSWTALRPGLDYSKLDERGIIREGEIVDDKTVIVGRYMVIPGTNDIKDASATPKLYTQGRVESVTVLHQGDGLMLVKIRVIEMRIPKLGDKFSSRHGQKGTIGMFVPAADMPRTADGIVPDVIVNPGGLISRMTVAQLIEMVAGKAAVAVAAKMNATVFCNGGEFVQQLGDLLQSMGAERTGENIMYSGISGVQIPTQIFMCPLYFMRLKHLTDDKVNARGEGKREVRTHQPTGGRGNEGGLRVGEMERDSLCAHGVSMFLQESMMKRGDATQFWICNGCGRIPIYNEAESLYVCPTCDGPLEFTGVSADTLTLQLPTTQSRATFSRIAMPYTLKLIDQEMTAIGNMGFRFVTESTIGKLRETGWQWPAEPVDFQLEEREDAGDAGAVNPEALQAATEAGKKPTRKKGVEAAAVAGIEEAKEAEPSPLAIRFDVKIQNEYIGFTNFANSPFRISGKQIPAPDGTEYPEFGAENPAQQTWPTVEHYYQAMKFPQDPFWQEEIRTAATPAKAKKMGLDREHPVRGDWDKIKERVMKDALLEKFKQNPGLLILLQKTEERPLINAITGDAYWGEGTKGRGMNRLGALLEEVRAELKDVRPDETLLGAAQPDYTPQLGANGENANMVNSPENLVAGAQEMVQKMLSPIPEEGTAADTEVVGAGAPMEVTVTKEGAEETANQQGGGASRMAQPPIYMFINPSVGGDRPRPVGRPSGGRNLSWSGMTPVSSTMGGGGGSSLDDISSKSGPVEITVEKEG